MHVCLVSTCVGHCVCVLVHVCLCAHKHTQSGLDGRMNRPQVLQLANGILPTQGGLWRREAKTEAPLLAKLYCGWPPCLQTLICITVGIHPLSYDPHLI